MNTPVLTTAQLTELTRAQERERIAKMVNDFSGVLPMHKQRVLNVASDDAAEAVRKQIAATIRAI